MDAYLHLLRHVRTQGIEKPDRTGTGTRSVFGWQMRFDLAAGFPLVTTKKVHWHSVVHELLWFLRGETNVRSLQAQGVSIWDEWADEAGELGPIYGRQWRAWPRPGQPPIDQLADVVRSIRENPHSRRHVVSAWNVGELDAMRLPPCHLLFQFWVGADRLSLQLYQRSADIFLGVPFNIASYALLLSMVARATGLKPGEFVHTLGDAHLYSNHFEAADLQLSRAPRALPTLELDADVKDLFAFRAEHIHLLGYDPHPAIKARVAV